MPRYHFDLIDSRTVADVGGVEVSDDIKAMDVAEELARRLARNTPELKNRQYSMFVSNEEGKEVCRARWTSSTKGRAGYNPQCLGCLLFLFKPLVSGDRSV